MKNYYIAVDHTAESPKAWSYIKFESTGKLTVREVRNWLIIHMKEFEHVWCIHIMMRTKQDSYTSIEYVTPDGCSYELGDTMKHVGDYHFNENNTVKI